jgi:four helix bundle protein
VKGYQDLQVWRKAMDLAVYVLSRSLPKEEQFRLTSQLLRAVASVPANIAEGYQRGTRKDYTHFISIARGSLAETETFLLIAARADLLPKTAPEPALALADELSRMLYALRQSLTSDP